MEKIKKSRISRLFESPPLGTTESAKVGNEVRRGQGHRILNVYCTAGYPQLNSTLDVMKALQQNGADIIELGMPYSDPLADGPVIQHSSSIALANGMTIPVLFEQLKNWRAQNTPLGDGGIGVPVILMGYMNPVLQYGFEKFCADAAAVGVDGLILPDLPEHEFETEYGAIIKKYGLDFIFLVTPETSDERIKKLDSLSSGFLYAVSSSSTTGSDKNMTDVSAYLKKLKSMQLKNPVLVGFGIKDKQTFDAACEHADGAIIGTAFIKALEESKDISLTVKKFLQSIKNG
jgi:tryptophan synthase alpha chain